MLHMNSVPGGLLELIVAHKSSVGCHSDFVKAVSMCHPKD